FESRDAQNLQDFVQAEVEAELLFEDGHQDVDADCHPHLRLHGVLGVAVEGSDMQMLFDPAKEQLDLPARAVELRDEQGRQVKIVGEKDQAQVLLGVEIVDAPQGGGIAARTLGSGQANGLIGTQPQGVIDSPPLASSVAHVLVGAGDKESQRLGDPIQPPVIDVAAVEKVEGSRFPEQMVEQLDVVHLPTGHINSGRNAAAQVQQGVQLHRTLVPPKLRPGKKRQAQIDGGGIEGVDRLVQFQPEGFVVVEGTGLRNEPAREIGIDAPIALPVGVGQIVAGDAAAKAHVVKLARMGTQAGFDVAQTLAISELGICQTKKLIQARETLHLVVAVVAIHATAKFGKRKKIHQ